jgi:hypothetical protein
MIAFNEMQSIGFIPRVSYEQPNAWLCLPPKQFSVPVDEYTWHCDRCLATEMQRIWHLVCRWGIRPLHHCPGGLSIVRRLTEGGLLGSFRARSGPVDGRPLAAWHEPQ